MLRENVPAILQVSFPTSLLRYLHQAFEKDLVGLQTSRYDPADQSVKMEVNQPNSNPNTPCSGQMGQGGRLRRYGLWEKLDNLGAQNSLFDITECRLHELIFAR